jgi:hypothetical protein
MGFAACQLSQLTANSPVAVQAADPTSTYCALLWLKR